MSFMAEKSSRDIVVNHILQYAKANDKHNKDSLNLMDWDVNNSYGCAMPQILLADRFEWVKDTSNFSKDFIKKYKEYCDTVYFLEFDVKYLEELLTFNNVFLFLPERMKIGKLGNFACNFYDKK